MLEYQKERFAKRFANYTLKIDPYVLRISGYNPQETYIKMGDYSLHCIPATFSLSNCTLLISLGEKEVDFFDDFKKTLITLNFTFDPAYFSKTTTFYLRGKFNALTRIKNGVYTLIFNFSNISNSYKEIFFYLSDVVFLHNKFYETDPTKSEDIVLTPKPFKDIEIYKGGKKLCLGVLKDINSRSFVIKKSPEIETLNKSDLLRYKISFNGQAIRLSGRLMKTDTNSSTFSLNYNTEYIHTLTRLVKVIKNRNDENGEKLEELK